MSDPTTTTPIQTTCVIAGGGPAGMMTGYLLARAGIDVHVLEKHRDFLRDFRGDTIHPSTLEVMDELGLGAAFDALSQNRVHALTAVFGNETIRLVDFRKLHRKRDYIAFIPQWDFLSFMAEQAARYPTFHLHMETEAKTLVEEGGKVAGLRAQGPDGELEFRSTLTIAADGRDSALRDQSGLPLKDLGAPMDVFWFRLDKPATAEDEPLARFLPGQIFIAIDRKTYWQCGYVVPKGQAAALKQQDFGAVMERLIRYVPHLAGPLRDLKGWEEMSLLRVTVNRLTTWHRTGLLCLGDAAHAMSPVGGVGINLAIQDAVAAGNILTPALRQGRAPADVLAAFQKRRLFPASATQAGQVFVQNRIVSNALAERDHVDPPLFAKLIKWIPALRGLPSRAIGLGVRPEHVNLGVIDKT